MATVDRQDITLEEDHALEFSYASSGFEVATSWWTARLEGPASTGERVQIQRSALHAGEALQLLEEALEKEGWTVR